MRNSLIAAIVVTPWFGSALASEVVLYDNANCAGPYRILIDSEADLDRTEFGNAVASVQVVAGSWTFFRDDNFQSNNGPEFTLSSGGCVNMGTGVAAQFPPELMDSVLLIQPAPGPGSAIVLYDGTNLTPPYRVLTTNTADLDAVAFDNRIASFHVVSGIWRIFRDDGFQANNGPPVEANGTVNNIAALGFPPDSASSVMRLNVASDPVPPPPPQVVTVQCPPGAATNGVACLDCAAQGQIVAAAGNACQCPPGQQTVGGRLVNGIPVGLCRTELVIITPAPEVPPTNCVGNEVMIGSIETGGGCLPCPEFTQPDPTNEYCQCIGGYLQNGIGSYGFPECIPPSASEEPVPPPPQLQQVVINGGDFFDLAQQRGFVFQAIETPITGSCYVVRSGRPEVALRQAFLIDFAVQVFVGAALGESFCRITIFGGALRNGWQFVGFENIIADECLGRDNRRRFSINKTTNDPADMTHVVTLQARGPFQNICTVFIGAVRLAGPNDRWRDAL